MFNCKHLIYSTVILQLIKSIHSVSLTNDLVTVEGLVHNPINVTLNASHLHSDKYDIFCTSKVPYISFMDEFSGEELPNLKGNKHYSYYHFSDRIKSN